VQEDHYQIYLPSKDEVIGKITLTQNEMLIIYSSELLLEEFIIIHDVISRLIEEENLLVDDSQSFLGYLPNGEPAYMIRNWKPWIEYIQQSMKNCQ
jgi:hypothetical protein